MPMNRLACQPYRPLRPARLLPKSQAHPSVRGLTRRRIATEALENPRIFQPLRDTRQPDGYKRRSKIHEIHSAARMNDTNHAISPQVVAEHGLSPAEYQRLLGILGREPSLTELGIFSVMWSEHCSYKSSRVWLKTLPTTGPQVIQGPGENAGVVDIGDGDAVIFKMESHNHPSYIEPYQGAATGVGGIMRDVFTMG